MPVRVGFAMAASILLWSSVAILGCEQGEHPRERAARLQAEDAAKKAQAEAEAARLKPSQSKDPGLGMGQSQSTLGKARDSALRVKDKAEARDKELGDLADEVQRGGG